MLLTILHHLSLGEIYRLVSVSILFLVELSRYLVGLQNVLLTSTLALDLKLGVSGLIESPLAHMLSIRFLNALYSRVSD